jgi:hypothetical protein
MSDRDSNAETEEFEARLDDALIVPLVFGALAVKTFAQKLLHVLAQIFDYAFPVLLQVFRFPLFTIRILGDGTVAVLGWVLALLPISTVRRDAWRAVLARSWAWLRQNISYKAFEEALHRAFENGMAWVFRKCRALTPTGALMVLAAAVLWLPISFGIATVIHAVLIAQAMALPAWMQLLHPLATIIAKSKLLVLPVYPAAWPQAKHHPFIKSLLALFRYLAGLRVMRKIAHRYRQVEHVTEQAVEVLAGIAARSGLADGFRALSASLGWMAKQLGDTTRAILKIVSDGLAQVPGIGQLLRRYAVLYGRAGQTQPRRIGETVRGLATRWSVNLSAEYYEARDRQKGAIAAGEHRT